MCRSTIGRKVGPSGSSYNIGERTMLGAATTSCALTSSDASSRSRTGTGDRGVAADAVSSAADCYPVVAVRRHRLRQLARSVFRRGRLRRHDHEEGPLFGRPVTWTRPSSRTPR